MVFGLAMKAGVTVEVEVEVEIVVEGIGVLRNPER